MKYEFRWVETSGGETGVIGSEKHRVPHAHVKLQVRQVLQHETTDTGEHLVVTGWEDVPFPDDEV